MKGNKNTQKKNIRLIESNKELKIPHNENSESRQIQTGYHKKKLADDQCLQIMDWAIKFLPLKYREKQID